MQKAINAAPLSSKIAHPPEPAAFVLRLFGPFEAQVGGHPLPRLRSRKGQWLLALLALRAGRAVERAWLAGTLWPDTTEENALVSLRQTLTDLRRALGTEGVRIVSPNTRTLSFVADGAFVDALAFDAAVQQENLTSLELAVALGQRPLLEDCLEEWALAERETRERVCRTALQTLAAAALAAGNFAPAMIYLRRILAADPYDEGALRDLLTALARSGQWGAVVLAYRDLRLQLQRELRAEPAAETRALYDRLRAEGRAHAPRPAERPEEQDPAPEAMPNPPFFPPISPLPRPLTELVGREQETRAVNDLLFRARLVTLTGPGGVGKTRLAIRAAEAWAEDQPDGICFVDLAPLTDAALTPESVAAALGVRAEPGRALPETLVAALQGRRLLLILDNCEHLLESGAGLAARLLAGCPALRILATSRQALGLTGETVWPVPSLSVPDWAESLVPEAVARADATQLFVERAAAALPGFAVTAGNARAVAQICRRLDGIPLAIELAAARVRLLTPEQIAARLDDRFHLLTGGSRTALPRQQTLRAAIDWSYDLLSEPERLLWMRLSVFAGGWTLDAAEGVCAVPGDGHAVLDLLGEIEEKSLVSVVAGDGPERRFRLLETFRHYAGECLRRSGQAEETARRHRDWALTLAETAETRCRGPEADIWLTRLEADHDNLRAALEACHTDENGAQMELRLAASLWRFWMDHGHYREGLGHLTRALGRAANQEPSAVRSKALNGAAALAWYQGDLTLARRCMEEALALARLSGTDAHLDSCLSNLGNVLYSQGDYAAARSLWEESLALRRTMDFRDGVTACLNNLGTLAFSEGNLPEAQARHEEALALSQESGIDHNRQSALMGLGNVAWAQGDLPAAHTFFEQSLAVSEKLGDTDSISGAWIDLGRLFLAEGDADRAETALRKGLVIAREAGLTPRALDALDGLAAQALERGEAREAACLCGATESLRAALALPRLPAARIRFDADLLRLQALLAPDPFQTAWKEGRRYSLTQATVFALTPPAAQD